MTVAGIGVGISVILLCAAGAVVKLISAAPSIESLDERESELLTRITKKSEGPPNPHADIKPGVFVIPHASGISAGSHFRLPR